MITQRLVVLVKYYS